MARGPRKIRRDLRLLKGYVKRVIGLDVDPAAKANPAIDEFVEVRDRQPWPLEAHSVDMVICDAVLEHLEEPDTSSPKRHEYSNQVGSCASGRRTT